MGQGGRKGRGQNIIEMGLSNELWKKSLERELGGAGHPLKSRRVRHLPLLVPPSPEQTSFQEHAWACAVQQGMCNCKTVTRNCSVPYSNEKDAFMLNCSLKCLVSHRGLLKTGGKKSVRYFTHVKSWPQRPSQAPYFPSVFTSCDSSPNLGEAVANTQGRPFPSALVTVCLPVSTSKRRSRGSTQPKCQREDNPGM